MGQRSLFLDGVDDALSDAIVRLTVAANDLATRDTLTGKQLAQVVMEIAHLATVMRFACGNITNQEFRQWLRASRVDPVDMTARGRKGR